MIDLRQYRSLDGVRIIGELVREFWGLELAFADRKGYVLDHADGKIYPSANAFCRQALFSKEGFRRCNESVKAVGDKMSGRRSGALVHQCHLGFDVVAAPIRSGGEVIGFLFTGGSYHREPKAGERSELFAKIKEVGGEAEGLDSRFAAIPRMSDRELELLQALVETAAREVMRAHESERAGVEPAESAARFGDIVGSSEAMASVFSLLEKIVRSESTVLVHGESGTGKELIARAIHYHGPRAKKPFVVQNCSAFNDNLLESALFGHVRGSFTGAVKDQKGLFEVADGGTFFLDEIGDMSPALQVKLLRVLQEGTCTPVGATKPIKVDVRIIAASHKDLGNMVERGEFREDLFYRVNVLTVTVPPLRERMDDLPVLAAHFLAKHFHGQGTPPRLAAETLEAMRQYRWPGNIRELENEIERLNVLAVDQGEIRPDLLSPRIRAAKKEQEPAGAAAPKLDLDRVATLRELVESVEAEVITRGLIRTHWNKSQLAKELGISRSNLIQKCAHYGLERKD